MYYILFSYLCYYIFWFIRDGSDTILLTIHNYTFIFNKSGKESNNKDIKQNSNLDLLKVVNKDRRSEAELIKHCVYESASLRYADYRL